MSETETEQDNDAEEQKVYHNYPKSIPHAQVSNMNNINRMGNVQPPPFNMTLPSPLPAPTAE